MDPYLPDIMEGVVTRVSEITQAFTTDPFEVFFDKGIYTAVTKNIYSNNPNSFPLVWLVMPFKVTRDDYRIYGNARCDMIIAMPTEVGYTQEERDELTFKPRLLPIYELLIQEISAEGWFSWPNRRIPKHDMTIRPYWGGSLEANGTNVANLFKKEIDAIHISGLELDMKREKCLQPVFIGNN